MSRNSEQADPHEPPPSVSVSMLRVLRTLDSQPALSLSGIDRAAFAAMHIHKVLLLCLGLVLAAPVFAGGAMPDGVLFTESFDDSKLIKRNWYDGSEFRIVGDAWTGRGCIEYEWRDGGSQPSASSGARHLIEPTDEVWLRFHLKLSKGWGWSGRNYHPHFMHFMTTENSEWHGPASSHLTLYVEPVNGRLRLAATDIQNKDSPHGLTQGPLKGGQGVQDSLWLDV